MADKDPKGTQQKLVPVDKPRGAPRRIPGAGDVQVPVGLEVLLYEAARDEELKLRVLEDPVAAAEAEGIELRPAERATLQAVSGVALRSMIDRLVPENPRGRPFMDKVAVAVTTLAAGTAGVLAVSCDSTQQNLDGGACPDCGEGASTTTTTSQGGTGGGGAQGGSGGAGAIGGAGGQGGLGGAGGDAGAGGVGGSGGT